MLEIVMRYQLGENTDAEFCRDCPHIIPRQLWYACGVFGGDLTWREEYGYKRERIDRCKQLAKEVTK